MKTFISKEKQIMKSILSLFIFIYFFCTSQVKAAGGIGSVWVDNITSTTIKISWTIDTNEYTVKGSPKYKICYKISGDVEGACNGGTVKTTDDTYFDITGLDAKELYKIKVIGQDVKKKGGGTSDRKIATITVKTLEASTLAGIEGNIWIDTTSQNSFDVEWNLQDPSTYKYLWLEWKRLWAWRQNRYEHSEDITSGTTYRISPLKVCKSYKILLWGYDEAKVQTDPEIRIVGTEGHTQCSGPCIVPEKIIDDFEDDIYRNYAIAIDSLYGCSIPFPNCNNLFNNLVQSYPQLDSARTILLSDGNDDIAKTLFLIEFLVVEEPAIYYAWQSDPSLVSAGLDLQTFTNNGYPGVWNMIQDECASVPTLSEWGLIIFSVLLFATVVWYLRRRKLAPASISLFLLVFTLSFYFSSTL
jgi:hypothetical protein